MQHEVVLNAVRIFNFKPPECLNKIASLPTPFYMYLLYIWETDHISVSSLKIKVDILSKMRMWTVYICVLSVFQLNV